MIFTLKIDTHYPEHSDVNKPEWAGEGPPPPAPEGTEAYDDWAYDELFSKTGTGREERVDRLLPGELSYREIADKL